MIKNLFVCLVFLCFAHLAASQTGEISGTVIEKLTGETLPGATVFIESINVGTVSDLDGNYSLNVAPGTYSLRISFVSFNTVELTDVTVEAGRIATANVAMEEAATGIEQVVVTAARRMNSEVSMINAIRTSNIVLSGVSSQQIARTQDRDASEVIKRVPGISIIDNRFIIARGLSQRYNNVWINNNAVPSSEADSRAFSFDMIPSGQIDNLMIVKSPAPELPADFAGGFVKIATKSIPDENSIQLSYGININTTTHFRKFNYTKGSPTDFLGFDNGFRDMRSVVPTFRFDVSDPDLLTDITTNGFNNDWKVNTRRPVADHRFSLVVNRFNRLQSGGQLGVVAALNLSYSYLAYQDMTNVRFGRYNSRLDEPTPKYEYSDDQYAISARTGGMLNIIWRFADNHRLEIRNIFNQQARNRYTFRDGWQDASGLYQQRREEYLYNSRGAYTGQLSGFHAFSEADVIDWTIGYSYANRNQPDRREIQYEEDFERFYAQQITRDFIRLDENTLSAGANYNRIFAFGLFAPSLKTGAYVEKRSRDYNTRFFNYVGGLDKLPVANLPPDFSFRDVATEIMNPEYYGANMLHIRDDTKKSNDYQAENLMTSAYMGLNVPLWKFNIYAGVRYENNIMTLTNYSELAVDRNEKMNYNSADFFPSVNITFNIDRKNLLRFAYGKSINRQEFREVAKSIYYDFDLFSEVKGNTALQQAYIDNFDFRYEMYPSSGEMISFALFYKKFTRPIEWTFIESATDYLFTFENAEGAENFGVEIDLRKSLDFAGLPALSLAFNGALIRSEVTFSEEESLNHNRPMQGQSPYIVNTGLFYNNEKLNIGIMYNIIGKRIVGIGRVADSQGGTIDNDVPDMFEMPRHALDLSMSYKFGRRFELSAGLRNILAAPIVYKQFPKFTDDNGKIQEREQITKKYKPGQNFSLTARVNL